MLVMLAIFVTATLLVGCGSYSAATPKATATATLPPVTAPWHLGQPDGAKLPINYDLPNGTSPQYGVLDLASGYLRLNSGPPSGWGTSIILLPAFWSDQPACPQGYCQSARVTAQGTMNGLALMLIVTGEIGGLHVTTMLQIDPPTSNPAQVHAHVTTTTAGNLILNTTRPAETFKLVMLSSMHDSATVWDARTAAAGSATYTIPSTGWIIQTPVSATRFGLTGGDSDWKKHAPTVMLQFATPQQVAGYVNSGPNNQPDTNPNDENVAFWAVTQTVPTTWSYDILVTAANAK